MLADNDLKSLRTKQKFNGLFDGGILSIQSATQISKEFSCLFKDKAKVYCETGDFLIGLRKEQRIDLRKEILRRSVEAKWEVKEGHPFKHHFLFEVSNSH